jgi:hypothetical protein
MRRRRTVCLFGLSADPPTGAQGHVGIVRALQQLNEWDEIWVLPVYRHTFMVRYTRLMMCAGSLHAEWAFAGELLQTNYGTDHSVLSPCANNVYTRRRVNDWFPTHIGVRCATWRLRIWLRLFRRRRW